MKRTMSLCAAVMLIAGIIEAGEILFQWEKNAEEIKNRWTGNFEVKKLDAASGDNIVADNNTFIMFSKDFIPVDYNKKYELSGSFKSIGKERSIILFGFAMYDKNKFEIKDIHANPLPGAALTELVQPAEKGSKSIIVKNTEGWKIQKYYAVAFDAASDFSDLPNRNTVDGIMNISKKDESYEIQLDAPLSRSYPAGTAVREHYGFGTYIYSAAKEVEVPDEWKNISGQVSGAKNGMSSHSLFRPGTAFVKIMLMPNFGQKDRAVKLAVNNIKVKEIE